MIGTLDSQLTRYEQKESLQALVQRRLERGRSIEIVDLACLLKRALDFVCARIVSYVSKSMGDGFLRWYGKMPRDQSGNPGHCLRGVSRSPNLRPISASVNLAPS